MNICPDQKRSDVISTLIDMIRSDNWYMNTGIYGNKCLAPALIESGHGAELLRILFNRSSPSFGTMMDDGATTVWERLELKSVNSTVISSYNHPMHGGFLYVCYEYLAGIRPILPGFKKFEIKPYLLPDINELSVSYECPYGKIAVSYQIKEDIIVYRISVPENTSCMLSLPGIPTAEIFSGEHLYHGNAPF